MDKASLLPADEYIVINRSLLNDSDKLVLSMLYMPLIGAEAITLYNTLYSELKASSFMSSELSHHHLMTSLGFSLNEIKNSRIKLEGVGLLKTYYKEGSINSFVYELYSPLSVSEFFNHPIFNTVLYNNVGKDEYLRIRDYFKVPRVDLSAYKDITSDFDMTFDSKNYSSFNISDDGEIMSKVKRQISYESMFDFDAFLSSFPKNLLNDKALTKSVRELINNLSYLYKIDPITMADIVKVSINEKGLIEKDELKINCRKNYQYNNNGKLPTLVFKNQPTHLTSPKGDNTIKGKLITIFESTSPYDFLKSKYKGVKPTERDMKILEMLVVDLEMNPAVVNVLIDFVLKTQNNRLVKSFIETIAGEWKRNNIETAKEAMEYAEKSYKKLKSINENKTNKEQSSKVVESASPFWLDKKISKKEMTKEERDELEDFLKEYV